MNLLDTIKSRKCKVHTSRLSVMNLVKIFSIIFHWILIFLAIFLRRRCRDYFQTNPPIIQSFLHKHAGRFYFWNKAVHLKGYISYLHAKSMLLRHTYPEIHSDLITGELLIARVWRPLFYIMGLTSQLNYPVIYTAIHVSILYRFWKLSSGFLGKKFWTQTHYFFTQNVLPTIR
jgi:hypothetical protein